MVIYAIIKEIKLFLNIIKFKVIISPLTTKEIGYPWAGYAIIVNNLF